MRMLTSIAAVAALTVAAAATAAEKVALPTLPPPGIVDGDLSDPCWAKAFKTPSFTAAKPGGRLMEATCAYAFCGESALYVAYRCEFADYKAREKVVADSKGAFDCDCVETFIDAGDTGNYAHFVVNVGGSVHKDGFCGEVKATVQLNERDWTAEIEIPYSSLKLSGTTFSKDWRMNLCRGNYGIGEISSWARLGNGTFHDTAAFNVVTGVPADLAGIARKQAAAAKGDFDVRLDHVIYAGIGEVKATLDMVREKPLGGYSIKARILDGARELAAKTVKPVYFHSEARLSIGGLPDGRYTCEVALVRPDGSVERSQGEEFWKIPPPKSDPARAKVEVRDQKIYVGGRFVLPVVTWKLSANGDFKTREEWEAANDALYADMAAHGINALIDQPSDLSDLPREWFEKTPKSMPSWHWKQYETNRRLGVGLADFARLAARHGIFIIHLSPFIGGKEGVNSVFARQCFVEEMLKYRDIPNILCWHTADETDGQIEENLLRNRLYHEIDPSRPTWLNVINAVSANKDAADILSTDPYPIPKGTVAMVAAHADRLKKNTEGRPSVASWLWLQNFGGEGSWTRPPTPEEIQAMAMLALNHGMSGIAYFNWTEPKRRDGVRQHPEGWSMLKEFNDYIQKWAEPMLTGKRLFLGKRGDDDVLEFEFGGKLFRSSVNVVTFAYKIEEFK